MGKLTIDPQRTRASTESRAPLRCARGLGIFLPLLVTGCVEPSDRIDVHTAGQGRYEISRVPKDAAATPAPSVPAAPAPPAVAPSQPPAVVTTPPPVETAIPTTSPSAAVPTDEASKQRRIDDLQKKVQEMNAEIERLKTQPTTTP